MSPMGWMATVWGVLTGVLVILLIYRSTLTMQEDEQLFLDDTKSAMEHFQAANGWQNKTVPDSRALIKLGLGPNHDHLLNPESAMTTAPETSAPVSAPAANGPSGPANQPQR